MLCRKSKPYCLCLGQLTYHGSLQIFYFSVAGVLCFLAECKKPKCVILSFFLGWAGLGCAYPCKPSAEQRRPLDATLSKKHKSWGTWRAWPMNMATSNRADIDRYISFFGTVVHEKPRLVESSFWKVHNDA